MAAAWKWYAKASGWDETEWCCESDSPEAALAELKSLARLSPGDKAEVVEARFSTDDQYEGEDFVPFVAMRNRRTVRMAA